MLLARVTSAMAGSEVYYRVYIQPAALCAMRAAVKIDPLLATQGCSTLPCWLH